MGSFAPIETQIKNFSYKLDPKFAYEIYGLVVTQYDSDNWLDYTHRDDPGNIKDVCVVWGENITNRAYLNTRYYSGEFTCFYQYENGVQFYHS